MKHSKQLGLGSAIYFFFIRHTLALKKVSFAIKNAVHSFRNVFVWVKFI